MNKKQHRLLRACSIGWLPGHTTPCAPLVQRRRAQEMTRSQMEVEGRTEPSPNFALPASLLRRCAAGRGGEAGSVQLGAFGAAAEHALAWMGRYG